MSEKKSVIEKDLEKVSGGSGEGIFITHDVRTRNRTQTLEGLYCKYCNGWTTQVYAGTCKGYDKQGFDHECNIYRCPGKNNNPHDNYFTVGEGGLI